MKSLSKLVIAFSVMFMCQYSFGILCLTDSFPPDRPNDEVVGRWRYNASFVVIGKDWIATTRHQGGSPATIDIDGKTYNCEHRSEWIGGPDGNADIRLIRLTNLDGSRPNLAYTPPYPFNDEKTKEIVIGGFGVGKDRELYNSTGIHYGYTWASESNTNRRWCTNIVMSTSIAYTSYTSDSLTAFFDSEESPYWTEYEGTAAMYDSGGGWFIKTDEGWKAAGLSISVQSHGSDPLESWFKSKFSGSPSSPDWVKATRISTYSDWIKNVITSCMPCDITGDSEVNNKDWMIFANSWNALDPDKADAGDFDNSGQVDVEDLISFAENWLY